MAGVPDCVSSCGSTNMCHLNHLLALPLPCVGEPTAASRVSPGSSPARFEASEGAAAFYAADAESDPEPEASAGRSTQMLLAMAAMGGRGGTYGRRPASSYGRKGGDGCREGGERRDGATPPRSSRHGSCREEEQGRLPTRGEFMKFSATPFR